MRVPFARSSGAYLVPANARPGHDDYAIGFAIAFTRNNKRDTSDRRLQVEQMVPDR
jgi:hypothetical protein